MKKYLALAILAVASGSQAFVAGQTNYFVGLDNLATLASGPFAGQANPNFGRLTFLFGHQYPASGSPNHSSNHYHAKSSYRLYREFVGGPILTSTTAVSVNGSTGVMTGFVNFLPETSGVSIRLLPGVGAMAGKYVTGMTENNVEWENVTIRPNTWLNRPGASAGDTFLYNSSGGRWNGSYANANLGLEIVSLIGGLEVYDSAGTQYSAGQILPLGTGDFNVAPIFAHSTEGATGRAIVRLVDLNGTVASSGTAEFRFQAVPEPATLAAVSVGAAILARRSRRKKQA